METGIWASYDQKGELITMSQQSLETFAFTISSDPQYPWYDDMLPDNLPNEKVEENSYRQIRQQYEDMNKLAEDLSPNKLHFPIVGHIINGDLTAYGHPEELTTYEELLTILDAKPYYPGLGNHDYANNVDDTGWGPVKNRGATGMVKFMYHWLRQYAGNLRFDFSHKFDFGDKNVLTGSLSYSFRAGKVLVVQLQNYPSYENDWTRPWANEIHIRSSLGWLKDRLTFARMRGDIVIVCLHDYHHHFTHRLDEFNKMLKDYGVSAVFAGHLHEYCGLVGHIKNSSIPYFRSGAAAQQNYLVANINTSSKEMVVRKREDKTVNQKSGNYGFTKDKWVVSLNDSMLTQAGLFRRFNGKTYLFMGDQYVRFSDASRGVDSGYPKHIAGNWPGMPDDFNNGIDAALWRESNGKIYLFKGDQYVRFTVVSRGVDSGYPKHIKGNWPGMPDHFNNGIGAALWSESNGKTYLFKGDQYVRFSDVSEGVDRRYPKEFAREDASGDITFQIS